MKTKVMIERQQAGTAPYTQTYEYELSDGMSVLNVLNRLEEADESLQYAYCCNNACCGICAVMCNGVPGLSCRTRAVPDMHLASLKNLPVVADLTMDRDAYDARRQMLKLYSAAPAQMQSIQQLNSEAQLLICEASRCIECLCCLAVCPVFAKQPEQFSGPCHFVLFARRFFDPREQQNRTAVLRTMNPQLCVGCGRCAKVCPTDANPAKFIARLQQQLGR